MSLVRAFAVVAVTVQGADEGDTTTWRETVETACQHLNGAKDDAEAASKINGKVVEEVVNDKGYHSNQTMVDLSEIGIRSYTSAAIDRKEELFGTGRRVRC